VKSQGLPSDVEEAASDTTEDLLMHWFVVTAGKQVGVFSGW
jgi:hypothetical protein